MLRPRRGPFPVPGRRTSAFLPWDRGSLKGVSKLIIQVGGRDEEPWAVSSHPCSRLEPPGEKCCDITLGRTSVDVESRRSGRGVMKNRLGSKDATPLVRCNPHRPLPIANMSVHYPPEVITPWNSTLESRTQSGTVPRQWRSTECQKGISDGDNPRGCPLSKAVSSQASTRWRAIQRRPPYFLCRI